ncbi:MAG: EAL domain-containing protein [Bacillota bacterium]
MLINNKGEKNRKRIIRNFLRLTLFLLLLVYPLFYADSVKTITDEHYRILIFHSYQESLVWNRDINAGIHEALSTSDIEYELYYEYMDSKREVTEEYYRQLINLYSHKYSRGSFDVIIAIDNNALNFLKQFSDKLFGEIPIIFAGVNGYEKDTIKGYSNITGVAETLSYKDTIDTAIKLHPDKKNIIIYGDRTTTYEINKKELQKIIPIYEGEINFLFKDNLKMSGIIDDLSQQSADSIVLAISTISDDEGHPLSFNRTAEVLSSANREIPVYGMWDFFLGKGIVGGKVVSGRLTGKLAAALTVECLKGKELGMEAADIDVINRDFNRYMFDYLQLRLFSINRDQLPENSVIINSPGDYWNINRRYIISGLLVLIISILIIIYLISTNRKLKNTQQELTVEKEFHEKITNYDELTSLPNIKYFREKLSVELKKSIQKDGFLAIMMYDLSRFSLINDIYGHHFGDRLLIKIGQRLTDLMEKRATIARISGDDFIFLFSDIEDIAEVIQIAEQILEYTKKPIYIDDEEIIIHANIGISIYPGDGANENMLIKAADSALYRAKEVSDTNYQLYNSDINIRNEERLFLEKNIPNALEKKQFVVYYQPIVHLETGEIAGAEALIRWQHPEKGLISPGNFIPYAEENGSIIEIGNFVIRKACSQFKEWEEKGYKPGDISINLSPRQFSDTNLINTIDNILREYDFDYSKLILEVTESAAIINPALTIRILNELRDMKIRVMLDDFGTGFSSLNYLTRFPVNGLKIDRSFINLLEKGGENKLIVSAIIAMAHELGIRVVAEGVETNEQLLFIENHNCDFTQGYYCYHPMPAKDFEKLLKEKLE